MNMKVTLKDGSVKEYAQPMSVYEIATDLSETARVATCGELDGDRGSAYCRRQGLPS